MVQAIENLTELSGKVLARKPHPRLPDYDILTVEVERANPVAGKANLLAARSAGPLELSVRRALLGATPKIARVRCRAKVTPDGAMCEPHPEAGTCEVAPE